MWTADKKLDVLQYALQPHIAYRKPERKIIFVDNEPSNFNGNKLISSEALCCSAVGQCSIPSCQRTQHDACNLKFEKKMASEDDDNVIKHYNFVQKILNKQRSRKDYFDGTSGVELNIKLFNPNKNKNPCPNKNTIYIFDWDRTLTQVEGFLFHATCWKEYYHKMSSYGDRKELPNCAETHLKMMCGGTKRYKQIQAFMRQAEPHQIYVLTNNPLRKLIYTFGKIMYPRLLFDNVHSMYEERKTKIEWIREFFQI